jgi:CPA1 family monovalent cation:H+ antiporter
MTLSQTLAAFLAVMACVGWVNARTLRLPQSVALLGAGIAIGALLYLAQSLIGPFWGFDSVKTEIARLDFPETVLGYLLAFLLFSSGLEVDMGEFRRRGLAILSLATIGVLVSTAIVGLGIWWISNLLGLGLPLPWALAFGALISPTDPVAVMANIKSGELSKPLGAVLQGEALFNDGVGLVAFTTAVALLGGHTPDLMHAGLAILEEVGGGLLIGVAGGWIAIQMMRAIDEPTVEFTATLAVALGVYVLAQGLHVSGPIAAAAAGLFLGSSRAHTPAGEQSRLQVQRFWHVVDEILNGVLFLLLGLQVFVTPFDPGELGLSAAAILLALGARLLVVLPWGTYFHFRLEQRGASLLLAWGGLRGAISLALAFSLPEGGAQPRVLATTFAVVIFSVVVQGLTFGPLARRLSRPPSPTESTNI